MNQFYNVTAISSEKEQLEKYGENEGVSIFYLPLTRKITPFQDLNAIWKLYKFLKKEKPHIVHSHTPKAGMVGMIASYFAKVPNRLHTVAGLPLMEAKGIKRKILNTVEKFTYKLATKVYPNSYGLEKIILDLQFLKKEKCKVLANGSSNGIDTEYFNPNSYSEKDKHEINQHLKISENDFVYIFVGRLVSDKGINELVTAFKNIQQKNKNTKLLLVGPLESELDALNKETLEQLTGNENIISVGYQQDVRPYFAIANVLTFPSYREGLPNVVLQAGAMGLSSIVTDINGCNEIIKQNNNGLIIPVKDKEALFNAMSLVLNEKKLTEKLTSNSRKSIVKRYQRPVVWDAILEEYSSLKM